MAGVNIESYYNNSTKKDTCGQFRALQVSKTKGILIIDFLLSMIEL